MADQPPHDPRRTDPARTQAASERLGQVVESSTQVLMQVTTVFPFTVFPTMVKVDREKLTITYKVFFALVKVISIQIYDIVGVVANAGPVFGSVRIFNRQHAPEGATPVNYMWRRDALKLKRLLEGHIIARERGVDLSALSTPELVERLLDLGAGTPAEDI